MELPQETDDYIRESIDHTVGLHVSTDTLLHKLQALEETHLRLNEQNLFLRSKLKEKDDLVERARAESSMNAVALKKFVEENQKLAVECSNLLVNCNKLERECSLYEQDREMLMDFANEADERAKEAEIRNRGLEEENKNLVEELRFLKCRPEAGQLDMEHVLLDALLNTMFGKNELTSNAYGFLEAHNGVEVCQKLLNTWTSLRPSTQKVVALAAEIKKLETEKDHLTANLLTAENEVNEIFKENNLLTEANEKLIRQLYQEKHIAGSASKHTGSASGKGKRKCSPKMSSPAEKKIDYGDVDPQRLPLSPLLYNSPESRLHKK